MTIQKYDVPQQIPKKYTRKRLLELLTDVITGQIMKDPQRLKNSILNGRLGLAEYENNDLCIMYYEETGIETDIVN